MMKMLVTGAAGFVGMHVAKRLLDDGYEVVGIDNLNDYYDLQLKRDRLEQLRPYTQFKFLEMDLTDRAALDTLFQAEGFERVIHLAAQAGVRHGIEKPFSYTDSNIVGFLTILEACRHHQIAHLVYASSSSVYGANTKMPFSVSDPVDHPISLYAATKRANELMAHTYSHLFGLPTTGLRFFTVYGPWGRPDMSPFIFAKAILSGTPINVFNHGRMQRDFTYVDDIVHGVVKIADKVPTAEPDSEAALDSPATSKAPFRLLNIGSHRPIELMDFIETLEKVLGKQAIKNYLPMQPGDVTATYADVESLQALIGPMPSTSLEIGVKQFANWYQEYYK